MITLPLALVALAAYPQFVTWHAVPDPEHPGKFKKFPTHWQTGEVCDAQSPANWTDALTAGDVAERWNRGHGCGVGFVFTAADPFFFLDIDGCLQPDGATWSPLALDLCARLAGVACEVSHSGRGLHLIGRGVCGAHGKRNIALGIELYTEARFVALTGYGAQGNADTDASAQLQAIAAQFFPVTFAGATGADWTDGPCDGWSGPTDDEDLIRRATAATSAGAAFGGKQTFGDLWTARIDEVKRSEADMSLANHLTFWTGRDCARMERLMYASGLAREKWDERRPEGTLLRKTILNACAFNVGQGGKVVTGVSRAAPDASTPAPAPGTAGEVGSRDPANPYLHASQQVDWFDGCFYVALRNEIFSAKTDQLLKKSNFDVIYGGRIFARDFAGQKKTDSAYDAFTGSLVNKPPIVSDLCFRPEIPTGEIFREGHHSYVNTYVPYECVATPGDPTPFLNHLQLILPNERDRTLILHYFAALVQHPGAKFQWCAVIQGAEGNGKTILGAAVTYCVGEHFTHLPNAAAMVRDGLKFNSWIERKLFVCIEEINVGPNRDFLEEFKTTVTNKRVPSEGKNINQTNIDNRANIAIFCNIKSGLPIKKDGRRYGMFFTAQQYEEDILRDGMGGDYFPKLWRWFEGPGRAIVAHYLKTFPLVSEMNPALEFGGLLHRAPRTSSTDEAVLASMGTIEQEVQEAIEEGRTGFAGGWVSSTYLDALIEAMRIRVARNRRRELMQGLGYDWHPALNEGRTNDTVTPDGKKAKLYLIKGHPAFELTAPADVAKAYMRAQEVTPASATILAFTPPHGAPKL